MADTFTYEYDFGEGWEFSCRKYKKLLELDDTRPAIVLEGAGQGLWEDDIGSLIGYLCGDIPADSGENEDMDWYLPWNYNNDTFGDFDAPLSVGEMQAQLENGLENTDFEELEGFEETARLLSTLDRKGQDIRIHNVIEKAVKELTKAYDSLGPMLVLKILGEELQSFLEEYGDSADFPENEDLF